MRQPVQLVAGEQQILFALCSDGTVWAYAPRHNTFGQPVPARWEQLPPIPQEKGEPE